MKRILSLILACAVAMGLCVVGCTANGSADGGSTAAPATAFSDVSANADYAEAVVWCAEKGLMQGVSASRFDPDGTLTRAMVATVLYREAGEPAISGAPAFTDTQAGQWYSNAVIWANEKGIVQGYGNGLFGTTDPVTKEQLDVMLRRYNGETPVWTGDPALAVPATRGEAAVAFYANLKKDEGPAPSNNPAPAETNEPGEPSTQSGKVLVAYYSATGSTGRVAQTIADTLDADLFEIVPKNDYTSADLSWTTSGSRVNREHDDESLRDIELVATTPENWDSYDVVFIGYPIWWQNASWVVNNFVKDNDFTGKTVIPFCTSASSGLGESDKNLAALTDSGNWLPGRRFSSGASQSTVTDWVDSLDLPAPAAAEKEGKTLVVYFSMPDNVDTSTVTVNGEILGNNQYMAQVIQETANADIFRIEAAVPYPTDHAALVDQASKERDENARPVIKETIENFDQYDTVFVGYPIWHADLPMILYTFFDSYDFSGKTLIPFGTHGGSGWAGTPATIERLEPNANILDGLSISRNVIEDARGQIEDWVRELGI